jgi:nucleotide-binding universal stress UspA family protein
MFSVHRILHPTDFSPNSAPAFEVACALARDYGVPLVAAHVVTPLVYGDPLFGAVDVCDSSALRERLEALRSSAPGVEIHRRLLEGDPAAVIVALACKEGCDLIVMGTHGRTGFPRLLMGSVAEEVSRRAPCPVLTVKSPAAAPEGEPARGTVPAAAR